MTAVAYDCPDCGVVETCGVDESGQRTCPACDRAVTGITRDEADRRSDVDL